MLFVFTLYKILLAIDSNQKTDTGALLKEMVFSPIIIAIAAGVVIGATGLYQAMIPSGISGIFDVCTSFVSAPTSAIILLTIGYDLVLDDIPWVETIKVVVLRLAIMLLLGAGLIGLLSKL